MFHGTRKNAGICFLLILIFDSQPMAFGEGADEAASIGRDCPSLRVVSLSEDGETIEYLPLGLRLVDSAGQPTSAVDTVVAGTSVIVSGRFSLYAGPEDVEKLKRQAEDFTGREVLAKRRKPVSSWVFLTDKNRKILWSRQNPGSSFERVPFQFSTNAGSATIDRGVVIVSAASVVPPVNSTLRIDWSKVRIHLNESANPGGDLHESAIVDAWTPLLLSGAVSLSWAAGDGNEAAMQRNAALAFVDLVRSQLVVPKSIAFEIDHAAPAPDQPSISIVYAVRQNGAPADVRSYDLSTHVTRTTFHLQESRINAN